MLITPLVLNQSLCLLIRSKKCIGLTPNQPPTLVFSFCHSHVRAWPGGIGDTKCGGNYAPGILPQQEAMKQGCQQVLWLFGPEHNVTEVSGGGGFAESITDFNI